MAPEICNHEKYDKSVDIWAIGIITYMLLSGRNPFPGNNEEIIEQITKKPINLKKPCFSGTSKFALDFIDKCTAKDPKGRWNSD